MSDDIILLGFYRILAFFLGFLLFGMGLFVGFAGNLIIILIPALSLFYSSFNLNKKLNSKKRNLGVILSILGFVSYAFLIVGSYVSAHREIHVFDLTILLVLAISVILYRGIIGEREQPESREQGHT